MTTIECDPIDRRLYHYGDLNERWYLVTVTGRYLRREAGETTEMAIRRGMDSHGTVHTVAHRGVYWSDIQFSDRDGRCTLLRMQDDDA